MKKGLLIGIAVCASSVAFAQAPTSFTNTIAGSCILSSSSTAGVSYPGHGLTDGGQDETNGFIIINSNKAAQQAQGYNAAPVYIDPYITIGSGETAKCDPLQNDEASVPNITSAKRAKITLKADSDVTFRLILAAAAGDFPASSTDDVTFAAAEFTVTNTLKTYIVDFSSSTTSFDFSYVDTYGFLVNPGEKDDPATGYDGKIYISEVAWGDAVTGVFDNTYKATAVNVYPNPAEGFVTVDGVSSSAVLSLKNANGIAVKSGNGATLALDGLNAGLYFLEVNDNGTLKTAKVMVK